MKGNPISIHLLTIKSLALGLALADHRELRRRCRQRLVLGRSVALIRRRILRVHITIANFMSKESSNTYFASAQGSSSGEGYESHEWLSETPHST